MKNSSAFTTASLEAPLPLGLRLRPDEVVVGWYRNPPPWEDSWVVFTTKAIIYLENERLTYLAIEDIIGYEPPESKTDVDGVRVKTRDGLQFVRVAGRGGQYGQHLDAFSFVMVLRALIPGTATIA